MESVLGRYRNLIILVGVLFLQVLGLAVQVRPNSGTKNEVEKTRLIRIWAVDAITPFERGLVWLQNGTGGIWRNYFYLRGVRAENRQLKEQISQMRLEQVRLNEDATQARRLQTLLAFKEQFISRTVAAQVIGSSGSDMSRTVFIDKGENAGLKRDMAVITADGIVGKVLLVYPSVSQILLINDQSSGVGAILEKTRLQGVLRGTATGEVVVERVMSDEQVPVGETVLTSGGDQIFPKGLAVGTVTKVGDGKDLFLNIKVKPAANLSKLEEVLVLVEKQERQATAEDSVKLRAADILAARLPSVPDKPAADAHAPATAATKDGSVAAGAAVKPSSLPPASSPAQPKPEVKPQPASAKPAGSAASAASLHNVSSGQPGAATTSTAQKTVQKTPGTTVGTSPQSVAKKPASVSSKSPQPSSATPPPAQPAAEPPAGESSPQ
jgi:rod shape-determining protein MreC